MERLHIVIDEDLDPIYGCVQGAHATAQFMLDNQDQTWNNSYLIFLKSNLNKITNRLRLKNIDYTCFNEPDLDDRLTAIAVLGNERVFKDLKLIGK